MSTIEAQTQSAREYLAAGLYASAEAKARQAILAGGDTAEMRAILAGSGRSAGNNV